MSAPFRAPWWLRHPHLQTVYGSLYAPRPPVAYRRERWETPDDDFVDVDFIAGPDDAPFVLLFHGLEGSSDSGYARALMAAVQARGMAGAVFNFRGCSGEPNRRLRAYHSGDSPELDWVIRRLAARRGRPLHAVGVSLGGNALLKWLGEQGSAAATHVERAAAVCAPVDLAAGGRALERGFCRFYGRHFMSTLRDKALAKIDRHPDWARPETAARLRAARTLYAFDNHYTAPVHGFRDTDDYWARASAKPLLGAIAVPTLLLNPKDDPFLPAAFLPSPDALSPAITAEFEHEGGHVGFVSGRFPGNIDWLPQRLLRFLFD